MVRPGRSEDPPERGIPFVREARLSEDDGPQAGILQTRGTWRDTEGTCNEMAFALEPGLEGLEVSDVSKESRTEEMRLGRGTQEDHLPREKQVECYRPDPGDAVRCAWPCGVISPGLLEI